MNQSTEHVAAAEPSTDEWVITRDGVEIGRSASVVLVTESYGGRALDPVPYVPIDDVSVTLVGPTGHSTHCPVKGDAIYYSVEGDEATNNGIWSYPTPLSPLEPVAGHVAFYPDRFKVERAS